MVATRDLRLVLTTPEKTLLDEVVLSLQVPMFDGSAGIMPGHAPIVGRLGAGLMTVKKTDGSSEEYFVDGGFVQVKGQTVSVLTGRALTLDEIDPEAGQTELDEANAMKAVGDDQIKLRQQAQDRARAMIALKKRR